MSKAVAYYICRSQLRVELTVEELDALYGSCTKRTAEVGVTGFLTLHDGFFYHFFEGTDLACAALHRMMQEDERHQDIRVLGSGLCYQRRFSNWSMWFMRSSGAYSPQFGACPTGLGRYLRNANAEAVLNHLLNLASNPFLADDPKLDHALRVGAVAPGTYQTRAPLFAAE